MYPVFLKKFVWIVGVCHMSNDVVDQARHQAIVPETKCQSANKIGFLVST